MSVGLSSWKYLGHTLLCHNTVCTIPDIIVDTILLPPSSPPPFNVGWTLVGPPDQNQHWTQGGKGFEWKSFWDHLGMTWWVWLLIFNCKKCIKLKRISTHFVRGSSSAALQLPVPKLTWRIHECLTLHLWRTVSYWKHAVLGWKGRVKCCTISSDYSRKQNVVINSRSTLYSTGRTSCKRPLTRQTVAAKNSWHHQEMFRSILTASGVTRSMLVLWQQAGQCSCLLVAVPCGLCMLFQQYL